MKLVNGFVIKTVGGKWVAVATSEAALRFKGMMVLNDTAKVIFSKLIEGETTSKELVLLITEQFDVSPEQAEGDVNSLLSKLESMNLII